MAGVRDPHALAAAAGRGLDHDGVADLVGDFRRLCRALDHAEVARDGRDLRRIGEFLRFDLVPHRLDRAGVGADEDNPGLGERVCERRPLGEKAVARVDGLGAGLLAGGDDLFDREIGLRRRRRPDRDRLVGHFDVQGVLVGVRIDRNGPNAQTPRGLDDSAGDFTAIGDQDFLEHRPLGGRPRFGSLFSSGFYWSARAA